MKQSHPTLSLSRRWEADFWWKEWGVGTIAFQNYFDGKGQQPKSKWLIQKQRREEMYGLIELKRVGPMALTMFSLSLNFILSILTSFSEVLPHMVNGERWPPTEPGIYPTRVLTPAERKMPPFPESQSSPRADFPGLRVQPWTTLPGQAWVMNLPPGVQRSLPHKPHSLE